MSGGKNRDWGYASYDVDRYDDCSDSNLGYTSYEKDGRVNKYHDNGDGGHSHESWSSSNDYNSGKDADQSRIESGNSKNPSIKEVENNGGCYLTSACMRHMQDKFDDNCYELAVLRWFRDKYVSKEDIIHYYEVAPRIIERIESLENKDKIYKWIYEDIVKVSVNAIHEHDYEKAYSRYKNSVIALEETFVSKKELNNIVKPRVRTI